MQLLLYWKSNVLHILSVVGILRYSACNTQAPYCHLWPAPRTIFFLGGGEVKEHKICVLIFSTTFV